VKRPFLAHLKRAENVMKSMGYPKVFFLYRAKSACWGLLEWAGRVPDNEGVRVPPPVKAAMAERSPARAA